MKYLCLFALSLLMLGGCTSRDDADQKMARGCEAGARAFMKEGFDIKNTKSQSFKTISTNSGDNMREITLSVKESDGWIDRDEEYVCTFAEEFSVLNLKHIATIYQLKIYNKIYGMDGNEIHGSPEEHSKLTETVQNAMK